MRLLHKFADQMAARIFTDLRDQLQESTVYGLTVLASPEHLNEVCKLLHATLGPIQQLYPFSLIRRYIYGFAAANPYLNYIRNPPNAYIYLSHAIDRYEPSSLAGYIVRRAIYRRCVASSLSMYRCGHSRTQARLRSLYDIRFREILETEFAR